MVVGRGGFEKSSSLAVVVPGIAMCSDSTIDRVQPDTTRSGDLRAGHLDHARQERI